METFSFNQFCSVLNSHKRLIFFYSNSVTNNFNAIFVNVCTIELSTYGVRYVYIGFLVQAMLPEGFPFHQFYKRFLILSIIINTSAQT